MLDGHRFKLMELKKAEKALNHELLNAACLIRRGKMFISKMKTMVVMLNADNLLELQACPESSKFGRLLGRKMFDDKKSVCR